MGGETNGSLVENRSVNGQPSKEVIYGELAWVKLKEATWWPAQVVDENFVSSANKPSSKGSISDVLVRLYGSYIYIYVDIHGSLAEFKSILIEKNFNYHEILKKSLEQDLPSLNSCKSRKRQSKFKGKVTTDVSDKSQVSSKRLKKEKAKTDESHPQTPEIKTKSTKLTPDTELTIPNNVTMRPHEFSARRVKVMQSLGLVAPSGSPFPRNRVISANLSLP